MRNSLMVRHLILRVLCKNPSVEIIILKKFAVAKYLITMKTVTIKNLEGIDKNSKYFFVKFQAPVSLKIFFKTYIYTFNSLTLVTTI